MYDFFLYSGSVNCQKCTGPYVVLKLLETLPRYKNFKIFFDNWFSSIRLCLALKDYGYLATATLRADRTKGCPLPAEKDLKKQGRRSHSFRTDANSGISVTKWFDNKCVQMNTDYCNQSARLDGGIARKESSLKLTARQLWSNVINLWVVWTCQICQYLFTEHQ